MLEEEPVVEPVVKEPVDKGGVLGFSVVDDPEEDDPEEDEPVEEDESVVEGWGERGVPVEEELLPLESAILFFTEGI